MVRQRSSIEVMTSIEVILQTFDLFVGDDPRFQILLLNFPTITLFIRQKGFTTFKIVHGYSPCTLDFIPLFLDLHSSQSAKQIVNYRNLDADIRRKIIN